MVLYLRVTPALKLIYDKHLSKEAKPVAFLYANVKLAKKKNQGTNPTSFTITSKRHQGIYLIKEVRDFYRKNFTYINILKSLNTKIKNFSYKAFFTHI